MKQIAIYGSGGFGREVACLINKINETRPKWELIGFFDDNSSLKGQSISHFGKCLGGIKELNEFTEELSVVIAVGSPKSVKSIATKIHNPLVDFPNIIHPDFIMVDKTSFRIGKGNIIFGRCAVSCDVSIGDFNVLDSSIVFGHDDKVGSYNVFMPVVRVSGSVTIGDENFFGVGSIILQGLRIGSDVRLAAGCVLMTKPKDGCLYIGNPARRASF